MKSSKLLMFGIAVLAGGCSSSSSGNGEQVGVQGCPTLCSAGLGRPYCVDTTSNASNCGSCFNACAAGQSCVHGTCVCPSLTPNACGSAENAFCTNFGGDEINCGGCGQVCAPGQKCSPAGCVETCATGTTACPSIGPATYCASLSSDNANCGECGNACAPARTCSAGECICTAGLTECSGVCVDLDSDAANCGSCGTQCPQSMICTLAGCACPPGTGACPLTGPPAYCTDFASDNQNCGDCGLACPAGQVCSSGLCAASCDPGYAHCGDACVNITNDPNNCGACFRSCLIGWACCGGQCVDEATDDNNCGACGVGCSAPESCVGGTCILEWTFALSCYRYTGCADSIIGTPAYDYVPSGASATFLTNNTVKVDLYSTATPPNFPSLYPLYTQFGIETGAPIASMVPSLPDFTKWPLLTYGGSIDGMFGVYGAGGSYEDHYQQVNRTTMTLLYGHRRSGYDGATCGYLSTGIPRKSFNYVMCSGSANP